MTTNRQYRPKSWEFPRWGEYGKGRDATALRPCEVEGCPEVGEHPAPKHRDSAEKFWFCKQHAAEYNRSWNYFAGMSEEARDRAESRDRAGRGYQSSGAWSWMSSDSPLERQRKKALDVLGLDEHATADEIKKRFRKLAKENHPDVNRGDAEAAERFREVCAAHEFLTAQAG